MTGNVQISGLSSFTGECVEVIGHEWCREKQDFYGGSDDQVKIQTSAGVLVLTRVERFSGYINGLPSGGIRRVPIRQSDLNTADA